MTMDQIDPNKAIAYIQSKAQEFADAKANRIYIENYLKTIKAKLMSQEDGTLGAKEIFAYSHPDYKLQLDGLKAAVEIEENLKWMLEAARLRVDVWKTMQHNARAEMRNLG